MQRATMFELGITPNPPSPIKRRIKREGLILSFYGELFTRHHTRETGKPALRARSCNGSAVHPGSEQYRASLARFGSTSRRDAAEPSSLPGLSKCISHF